MIDFSDLPEVTRSMKARKNPFYERIMKEGFTVKEYYSPEDIKNIKKGNLLSLGVDLTALYYKRSQNAVTVYLRLLRKGNFDWIFFRSFPFAV